MARCAKSRSSAGPDREWGEVVVAYVVGEAKAAELDALCLARIARFKRPKDYVFVDALPKNNYGKILKTELRATRRGPQVTGVGMADIVLAIGTSHSPLLNSPAEDYPKHAAIDASGRKLIDKNGKPCTYGELLAKADPSIKRRSSRKVLEQRSARCTENIARLSRELADAKLDALIIIGDDQHEQFFDDNMPAILIYWGETIENNPLHMDEDAPQFWRKARSQFHETEKSRAYPVDAKLGLHLIEQLVEQGFDVSQSKRLAKEHGEGHAFGFVHRRMMNEHVIPIVPVALNTYFPPNQPRPRRCYELGQAIRAAVQSAPGQRARRHSRVRRLEPFHRRRGARPRRARGLQEQ